ncbi:GCN5-related N-acetyltransferase [Ephemerocybe angulata]|uniref:GCN5-related N-acetyltransferase n=1 Tax=Ephemerocybe angulata TaxID=980116 RepID=A0A8H6M160_9AGAR|nr:GCN5-related N-acetyltransferase [Tulosesus angulatus]
MDAGGGISFQVISADQTIALRHSVLWPNAPVSQVLLPEDNAGIHVGAFITGAGIEVPIAVISLFLEPLPIDNANDGDDMEERNRPTSGFFSVAEPGTDECRAESATIPRPSVRFRKFACNPLFQGQGVGSGLLEYAIETVAKKRLGGTVIWCDARVATEGWYRRRWLAPFGKRFYKSDVEYVRMKRDL